MSNIELVSNIDSLYSWIGTTLAVDRKNDKFGGHIQTDIITTTSMELHLAQIDRYHILYIYIRDYSHRFLLSNGQAVYPTSVKKKIAIVKSFDNSIRIKEVAFRISVASCCYHCIGPN